MKLSDLFEEMQYAYDEFCLNVSKFMDEAKNKTEILQNGKPDYKSWVGKIVWVWDNNKDLKAKAILTDYDDDDENYPFVVVDTHYEHAELCEEQ